jgi:sensor histidine kinase YesM
MRLLNKIIRIKTIQHFAFWMVTFFILLWIFKNSGAFHSVDFIYTAVFTITLAFGVYANLLYLIPFSLEGKRYMLYGFLFILNCILFSALNILVFDKLIDLVFPGYYFISYYDFSDVMKFFLTLCILTTLLKLSKGWFLLNETKKRIHLLEKQKAEAELNALKSQVNPHFLFNSLNSIYALTLRHSPETTDVILKLSDFLRYIIYETSAQRVLLQNEINAMQRYIDLQHLRTGNRADITLKVEGVPGQKTIAPLLFLPLIENGFKHGITGDTGPVFLHILLTISETEIVFNIENNKGSPDETVNEKRNGFGLQNLKKRLEAEYPGQSVLQLDEDEKIFKVKLSITDDGETQMPDH